LAVVADSEDMDAIAAFTNESVILEVINLPGEWSYDHPYIRVIN
jgi:hypothetical protein